jgi:hypothetical protein
MPTIEELMERPAVLRHDRNTVLGAAQRHFEATGPCRCEREGQPAPKDEPEGDWFMSLADDEGLPF